MLGQVLRGVFAALVKRKTSSGQMAGHDGPNPLAEYVYSNPGRGVCRWYHYLEIFHRHLAKFRGRAPVVVEIGVAFGGSMEMWHYYFGPGTRLVGIDVDPACRQFEDQRTTILIGDQADRGFLADVRERVPRIDVLIDDGGHRMVQQITTFEELYPHVHADGVYLCEDMHTSLWPKFGGGYGKKDTFLEYSKALVDRLHSWHSLEPGLQVDEFTRTTHAIHFYDSVVVIEKRHMEQPRQFLTHESDSAPGADSPKFRP
jgi:hypothetical protein